jgi:hypothetical protein
MILKIRYPSWANDQYAVSVNGRKIKIKEGPGSYISIRRKWGAGDQLSVDMPFSLNMQPMPDDSNRVALFYGPLVMAGDLGPAYDSLELDPLYVPGLVTKDRDPSKWLVPVVDEPNKFITHLVGKPEDVTIRPLYRIYDRNYTVYWDLYTEEEWNKHLAEVAEWRKDKTVIEKQTIDYVSPGPDTSSQSHNFKAKNPGFFEFNSQNCVEARFGWFSYDMKVVKGKPAGLMVEYWGGFPGPRKFEIRVDGKHIALEDFSSLTANKNKEIRYEIPAKLTERGMIKVTFSADDHQFAGPVFSIRTVRNIPKD